MLQSQQKPYLDRFPVFDTTNVEEMRHALVTTFRAHSFDCSTRTTPSRNFGNHARLQSVELSFCDYGEGVQIGFPELDAVRQQFCLTGLGATTMGSRTIDYRAHQNCIIPAGVEATLAFRPSYKQLVLKLATKIIDRKLEALVGAPVGRPLEFCDRSDANGRDLQALVLGLAEQLNLTHAALPGLVLDELQQSITVAFLLCNRHSLSALLDQDPTDSAPAQVKRAEEYIEANWNAAITIEALADISNCSVRSLFKAFKKSRGYTPMAFAKKVRLKHARTKLLFPEAGTSVTGVALACGFMNHGHFSRDYRQVFGELPSVTLAQGKRT